MSDGENAAVDEYKCGKGHDAVELSSKCWDSSNERKYASGTDKGYYMRQVSGSGDIGAVRYARTITYIR